MAYKDPRNIRSAAELWAPLRLFVETEARLAGWAARGRSRAVLYEFLRFGVKQAWACLFGGIMVSLLMATYLWYPRDAALPRYDFLVFASLGVQAALIATKMETLEEARVIFVFHLVGTAMEVFKTANGSWTYPEWSYLRIGGVPLFTGFMYASVGSYIARAWRLFDYRFTRHPPLWQVMLLAAAIYLNFFLDHWGLDIRLGLFGAAALIFWPTFIHYRIWRVHRSMPILLACGLAAFFIWIAENVGTFARAWCYPSQADGWRLVGFAKFSSWFLLLVISYALVALLHRPRPPDKNH
jgi:uncharacterized membrane protein YoaT (DUF817 family)